MRHISWEKISRQIELLNTPRSGKMRMKSNKKKKPSATSSFTDKDSKCQASVAGKQVKAAPDPVLTQAAHEFITMAIPSHIDDYLRSLTLLTVNMQIAHDLSNVIVRASRTHRDELLNNGEL